MLIDLVRAVAQSHPTTRSSLTRGPHGHLRRVRRPERRRSDAGSTSRSIETAGCLVRDVADAIVLLCASSAVGAELCVYSPRLSPRDDRRARRCVRPPAPIITDGAVAMSRPPRSRGPTWSEHEGALPEPPERAPGPDPHHRHHRPTEGRAATTGPASPAAVRRGRRSSGHRWLLAYNLNQFAGIQVLLHVLANGATLVVPASNQPRDALGADARPRRHPRQRHPDVLAVPRRAARRRRPPRPRAASRSRSAARPCPAACSTELGRLFPDARISQVYASTEFGSSVSVARRPQRPPASRCSSGPTTPTCSSGSSTASCTPAPASGCSATTATKHRRRRLAAHRRPGRGRGRPHPVRRPHERDHQRRRREGAPAPRRGGWSPRSTGVELAACTDGPTPVTGQIVAVDVVAHAGLDTEDARGRDPRRRARALPAAPGPRRIRFVDTLEMRENKIVRRPADPRRRA